MFFVAQPEYYRQVPHRVANLNELCLLNGLQRQYAYRQQQQEKRQIQRANQPEIELTQDLDNYYIILTKMVNDDNYSYMHKFNGYSLKQVDRSLIVRSTRDNFYRNITLPSNTDLEKDISYKILNGGYKMVVSVPKKRSYQIKTASFGLPDLLDSFGVKLLSSAGSNGSVRKGAAALGAERAEQRDGKNGRGSESRGIRIPISDEDINTEVYLLQNRRGTEDSEAEGVCDCASDLTREPAQTQALDTQTHDASANVTLRQVGGEGSEAREREDRCQGEGARERTVPGGEFEEEGAEQEGQALGASRVSGQVSTPPDVSNSDVLGGESVELEHGGDIRPAEGTSASLLKNYNTLERKTVFLPNTSNSYEADDEMEIDGNNEEEAEEEVAIPVRRTKSPTLEEVVDEEFL